MAAGGIGLAAGKCAVHYDRRYLNAVKNLNGVKILLDITWVNAGI
jgi:hypothetical protein